MKNENLFIVVLLIICSNLLTSCKKKETKETSPTPVPTPTYAIGDNHAGGIVFVLDSDKQHGLVAAASDQSGGIPWSNGSMLTTFAYSTSLGSGKVNTDTIVASFGAGNYAAKLCSDLTLNGYNDWYLPSLGELDLMYTNKAVIGGFTNNYYWSSSESPNNSAWQTHFGDGHNNYNLRTSIYPVRAIRSF